MKAITQHRYGHPLAALQLEDVDQSRIDRDDEVLVRVQAAGLNALDWHVVTGQPRAVRVGIGVRRPKAPIAGVDVAGIVEAVGPAVTRFRPGDPVFGWAEGAFAEHVVAPEHRLVARPPELPVVEAATLPVAALTAIQALRAGGELQAGQSVLVSGASGGVGSFAVQLAKAFGAEVTAVCSTRNLDLARGLGADTVVDYTREDFTRSGRRYDRILDIAGSPSIRGCLRSLTTRGVLVLLSGEGGPWVGPLPRMARGLATNLFTGRSITAVNAKMSVSDLETVTQLVVDGRVRVAIDRTYDLAAAPEAVDYLLAGHTQGKVVVNVA